MNKLYKKLSAWTILVTLLLTSCVAGQYYPLKMDNIYYRDPDSGVLVKYSSESGYTDKEIALIKDEKLTYPDITRKNVIIPCGKDFSSTGALKVNMAYSVVEGQIVLATPTEIEAPFEYINIPGDTSRIFIWVGNTGVNLLNLSEDTASALITDTSLTYIRALEYIQGEGLLYQAGGSKENSALYLYDLDTSASRLVTQFENCEFIKVSSGKIICASVEYNNDVPYYRTVDSLDVNTGELSQLYRSTRKGEIFSFIGQNMIYSTPGNGVFVMTDYTTGESKYYDIGNYAEVSYALLSFDGEYVAVLKDQPDANGYIYISLITLNLQTGDLKEHYNSIETDDYNLYYTEWFDADHLIINYLSDSQVKSGYSMIKTINH